MNSTHQDSETEAFRRAPSDASADATVARPIYTCLKRAFDLTASLLGLIVLSPLGALIAISIKLSDGGPVLYRQRRIGWKGRPFEILKFRSMVVNAHKLGPAVTKQGDNRVTRIGRILRKAKLDELPQLWNVLVGEMSLVGPRPEVPSYVERYSVEQRRILAFKPGITDLATLMFRDEEALLRNTANVEEFYLGVCVPRKCQLNLTYARRANLLEDLFIIVQTLCPYWVGVSGGYALVLLTSFWLAYELRFDFRPPAGDRLLLLGIGSVLVPLQMLVLFWRGHFTGLLSFFNFREMKELALGLGLVAAIEWLVWIIGGGAVAPARSIILIDGAVAFLILAGTRTLLRRRRETRATRLRDFRRVGPPARVGIVGAGELGAWLVNELNFKRSTHHQVEAIFDDDPEKWNKQLHGVPIVGMPECLLNGSWAGKLDEVIITLSNASRARLGQIESVLNKAQIKFRALPQLHEVLSSSGPAKADSGQADREDQVHIAKDQPSYPLPNQGASFAPASTALGPDASNKGASPSLLSRLRTALGKNSAARLENPFTSQPGDVKPDVSAGQLGRILKFLAMDGAVVAGSFSLAYLIRFDFDLSPENHLSLSRLVPLVLGLKLLVLYGLRQFEALPDYFGLRDLRSLAFATGAGSLILALGRGLGGDFGPPLGIILIDGLLCLLLLSAIRLGMRLRCERRQTGRPRPNIPARRVAIVGAGEAGAILVRELISDPSSGLQPVAFYDDEKRKWGTSVYGIPIMGPPEVLSAEMAGKLRLDEVIISMPSASADRRREVIRLLQQALLSYRTVPSLTELALGRVAVSHLRPVEVEDLLGRPPIQIETDEIRKLIAGQCVMVTGAGGSIGSELCRQIAAIGARRLLLVERSEGLLFVIEQELIKRGHRAIIEPLVADILDKVRMRHIFERFRPQLVFHAAAHKHVPMMEEQPGEAIRNNTLGTASVAELALDHAVEKFVLISTDKAINPTSVMGATKRLAEMFVQALAASHPNRTRFMAVRFGNVLGSSGSVIPIFKQQIAAGGPVTVTHPEMTRYFMTIPEAVGLVLQTTVLGKGGEVFVLDMGKPVRIVDLARQLIALSGFEPDKDIKVEFVGLRPGEKLFEELAHGTEALSPTDHPRISRLSASPLPFASLEAIVGGFTSAVYKAKAEDLKSLLKVVIPEYTPYAGSASNEMAPTEPPPARSRHAAKGTSGAIPAAAWSKASGEGEVLNPERAALDQRLRFVKDRPIVSLVRNIALKRAAHRITHAAERSVYET